MSPTLLFRIASGLLVVFALSHTVGLLRSKKRPGAPSDVWNSMRSVHFRFMGSDCTWGGFYVGFGLLLTAYLLFTAYLSWQLGELVRVSTLGALAWPLVAVQAVNALLSFRYFFAAPAVISALITLVLAAAAWTASG